MRYRTGHKTLVALSCAVLGLSAGCGGTQQPAPAPPPDVEANLEARVAQEVAAEATVEAKAKAQV